MKIVLHPEALRELREAQAWYAKQGAAGYGERLMELVDAKIQEIAAAPESLPNRSRSMRSALGRVVLGS